MTSKDGSRRDSGENVKRAQPVSSVQFMILVSSESIAYELDESSSRTLMNVVADMPLQLCQPHVYTVWCLICFYGALSRRP